jgi:hypothetical protein
VQKAPPSRGGVLGRRGRYLPTVIWLTSTPSLSNSPWMRGAPQNGVAELIRRIRSPISALDRPERHDRHRQRKPLRCHPITVAGLTSTKVSRNEAALGRATPRTNDRLRRDDGGGGVPPENDNLMSQGDELQLQRCAAANTEREQGNGSRQKSDHAPQRYGGGARKFSIILDASQF